LSQVSVKSVTVLMYVAGGHCSELCEVLDGQRRCWGAAADMCQTCQFLLCQIQFSSLLCHFLHQYLICQLSKSSGMPYYAYNWVGCFL